MAQEIIYKLFKTYKHPYVYDRHTNMLIRLTEQEWEELDKVEKAEMSPLESGVIRKYQEFGAFAPNIVDTIEHPAADISKFAANWRMNQLILQVTQQCNLRCSYCVYSGMYEKNRGHANERMSFETAKKAIDFFLTRSSDTVAPVISFYGGEPLLKFELIQQCVEYAKQATEGRLLRFSITTNGTLLSDDIVDFMVQNDFILSVSIDGSKPEHDFNRKFSNGAGSFDRIINNIVRIRERYPEYDKKIQILTTVNPHADLSCALEFFDTSDVLSDKTIMFNDMNELGLKDELDFDRNYYRTRYFEYLKMLAALIGKIDVSQTSKLTFNAADNLRRRYRQIHKGGGAIKSSMHHAGPCVPGVRRLFVDVSGALFPCERVNEVKDYHKIGTLDEGLYYDRIKGLLNIGKLVEDKCKRCWKLRLCSHCVGQLEFDSAPTEDDVLKECSKNESIVLYSIYELAVLSEFELNFEQ